jgi:hypothetical protein
MTCHPNPALREKDLFFLAARDEVGRLCYSSTVGRNQKQILRYAALRSE